MMKTPSRRRVLAFTRGFTLLELMIVIAVVAVVLVLAAPSIRTMIDMQRLRGISAQLLTDIQFARSEAVSRQEPVAITYNPNTPPAGMTCYIIHTCGSGLDHADPGICAGLCNCAAAAGAHCGLPAREIRAVQVLAETKVQILPVAVPPSLTVGNFMRFDPITGGIQAQYIGIGSFTFAPLVPSWVETSLIQTPGLSLRTITSTAGRPSVCAPGGGVSGVPACP